MQPAPKDYHLLILFIPYWEVKRKTVLTLHHHSQYEEAEALPTYQLLRFSGFNRKSLLPNLSQINFFIFEFVIFLVSKHILLE